jgi:hypothetical protein
MATVLLVCLQNAGRSQMSAPAGRPLDEVRATRDEIARRVSELVAELDHE